MITDKELKNLENDLLSQMKSKEKNLAVYREEVRLAEEAMKDAERKVNAIRILRGDVK